MQVDVYGAQSCWCTMPLSHDWILSPAQAVGAMVQAAMPQVALLAPSVTQVSPKAVQSVRVAP